MHSAAPAAFRDARRELLLDPGAAPQRRRALADLADAWLGEVFAASGAEREGYALVAVGGYGRRELSPGSDLDVMLLVPDRGRASVGEIADRIWYPLWDGGVGVDHSVRSAAEARRVAATDLRAALAMLDMRTVSGSAQATEALRSSILADWRARADRRLPELRESVAERRARHGDLGHLIEPDLKESYGGLRDISALRAVAASWVMDVPHEGIEAAHSGLLDVRDALHVHLLRDSRRPGDILRMQEQDAVADELGLVDADELLRRVSDAARTVTYASDVVWTRVARRSRTRPASPLRRRMLRPGLAPLGGGSARTPLAEGVVVQDGEAGLALDARPERDPVLVLRLSAAAAQAGLPLSPAAVRRLAAESAALPEPWPDEARECLVSLLGSGPGLVGVWEALDRVGIVERLLPEWTAVRSAPQRNPLHVYRVDRHLVEAAAHASDFVRDVDRPDLLLVACLLHDIGKARGGDHTAVGEVLVADMAPRMGFNVPDTSTLVALVRHHLLLPDTATRRDLDDPLTIAAVADAVGDVATLDLLHALTRADAAATGPAAWSEWKAALVEDLVARVRAVLGGRTVPAEPALAERLSEVLGAPGLEARMSRVAGGVRISIGCDDRPGLLATIAGVLALNRLEVRSADTQTVGKRVVSEWVATPLFGEPVGIEQLRSDLGLALSGDLDVAGRLAARSTPGMVRSAPARVDFVPGASSSCDVLEVRAHDEPGLLYRIGSAACAAGAFITAARICTLGSEAVDVFYMRRADGERLDEADRERVVSAVLAASDDPPRALS